MRPLALKWRLSLLMALAVIVSISVICVILYQETRELLLKQTDQSLLSLARAAEEVTGDLKDPTAAGQKLAELLPPGRHMDTMARIWTDPGAVIHSTPAPEGEWDKALSSHAPPAGEQNFFEASIGGRTYRCVWLRAGDDRTQIVIGQSTRGMESTLRNLLVDLTWIALAAVAAMVAFALLLVRIGLRPVCLASARLKNINARTLPQAGFDARMVPIELAPFADSLQEMLHRLNDAMRREKAFTADASHELRTPITAAKSTIQATLASPRSAGEYRQSLEEAQEDLRRMEHLVDELLLLARLDEQTAPLPDQLIQVDRLLAELADSFEARVADAGGKLISTLSPAVVAGDEGQLSRLVSNLLDNAVRHGPRGGTIYLLCQADTDHVRIVVKDDGGNVPPEVIPRLFERFYRTDASRASSTGGTGLGLAIAREIVLRHGGTIEITSRPTEGTQVIVTFPKRNDAAS